MLVAAACHRHRAALVDLVEHGERGPGTVTALDHVAVCEGCQRTMTELALTVAALRRASTEVRRAPVPEISRERIVRLAERPRTAWRWRLQLGSLATSAAIAAAVLVPGAAIGPDSAWAPHPGPDAYAVWRLAESRIAAGPDYAPIAVGSVPPRYPDGRLRPWKEVRPIDESRRPV
jgi:hypothetical protein